MTGNTRWICAQLGSREHYAIPRVLHASGRLDHLLTDFWASPRWFWENIPGKRASPVRERWHQDLRSAAVHGLGLTRLAFDASNREPGWETTMRRNLWFQQGHLEWLERNRNALSASPKGVFFTYSYAGLELLRFFKELGWKTILGQIDPGPREEKIVSEEAARFQAWRGSWAPAPDAYWRAWREELELADRIIVNSEWSLECLRLEDVPTSKMRIVPLALEKSAARMALRTIPERFTKERPLRVLFLGQVNLRKGAHQLIEAARRLSESPVEFVFVGPVEISRPGDTPPNVKWHGAVSREETARFYANADVFALPTLSDGFALTQLEALSHGLPVIATTCCARVVRDGWNGWVLESPSSDSVTAVMQHLIAFPSEVRACASRATVPPEFSMESLRVALLEVENELL